MDTIGREGLFSRFVCTGPSWCRISVFFMVLKLPPEREGTVSCVFLEVSAVSPMRESPGRFLSVSVGSQLLPAQNNPYATLEAGTELGTLLVLLKSWPL